MDPELAQFLILTVIKNLHYLLIITVTLIINFGNKSYNVFITSFIKL